MIHFLMKFQELPNDPKTVDTEKDNKLSYKWKIIDQENCVFPAFQGEKKLPNVGNEKG